MIVSRIYIKFYITLQPAATKNAATTGTAGTTGLMGCSVVCTFIFLHFVRFFQHSQSGAGRGTVGRV